MVEGVERGEVSQLVNRSAAWQNRGAKSLEDLSKKYRP